MSTKVVQHVGYWEMECFRAYGCCVVMLPEDDSIPVGHRVDLAFPDGTRKETVVVAKQHHPSRHDFYVFAVVSQVTESRE